MGVQTFPQLYSEYEASLSLMRPCHPPPLPMPLPCESFCIYTVMSAGAVIVLALFRQSYCCHFIGIAFLSHVEDTILLQMSWSQTLKNLSSSFSSWALVVRVVCRCILWDQISHCLFSLHLDQLWLPVSAAKGTTLRTTLGISIQNAIRLCAVLVIWFRLP